MPIYEYECTGCTRRFDMKRSYSEADGVICPHCGCGTRRIFIPVPIIFKGSGFYVTDHRGGQDHSSTDSEKDGVKASSSEEKS